MLFEVALLLQMETLLEDLLNEVLKKLKTLSDGGEITTIKSIRTKLMQFSNLMVALILKFF